MGALSTVAREPEGYPFGSLVAYAVDEGGHPLLLISRLAEHTSNVDADPRGSLLVAERSGDGDDPLAHGRVTLLGPIARIDDADEVALVRARYLDVHPNAAMYVDFPDFAFYRLTVTDLRYVGGFGRMSWVDAAGYIAAEADPLAAAAPEIVAHMNDDHAIALLDYCRGLAGRTDAESASMTGVDRYGFDVVAMTPDGPTPVRIDFTKPMSTVDQVRGEMVRLVREAREQAPAPS